MCASPFFYARETPGFPVCYFFLVSLLRFECWFLGRKTERAHHLPCSNRPELHLRRFFQNFGKSIDRPEIRLVSCLEWTFEDSGLEFFSSLFIEDRIESRRTLGAEAFQA